MSRLHEVKIIWGDLHLGSNGMFNRLYSKTFKTKEAYFRKLIEENNRRANDSTVVLFLGDIGFLDSFHVLEQMSGYKILIKGNHDKYNNTEYLKYFKEVYDHPLFIHPRIVFSHIPIPVEEGVINIHGHTHEISLNKSNYFNVCVERTGYQPVTFKWVNRRLSMFKKPSIKFLEEWYKDIQVSKPREDLILNNDGIVDVEKSKKLILERKAKGVKNDKT